MSSKTKILKETETPPLFDYLKQEIPIEDMRDYSSPKRIKSIDFVKGFAIIMIMMAHTAAAWLDKDWLFVYAMLFAVMDILGPSLFIFLSALSVIFSIKKKKGKVPEKVIRFRIFSRGGTIILIGMLFNLAGLNQAVKTYPFPLNLWGWNILMFLGFSQIFSYYALKLRKMPRAVIGLIIIAITMPIRAFLYLGKDSNIIIWLLHFIITSPAPQLPVLPWISICFISTIFGEYLYEAMMKGTDDAYIRLFRIFIVWGTIFVVLGIIFGWRLQTAKTMSVEEYLQLDLLRIMNQQNYYKFPGMPEFLIRGTLGNMLYNLGAALLLIAISFYYIDIKKGENDFTSMFIYYGKISLSLFLIHYIFIVLYVEQFNIIVFLIVVISYVGFMGFTMYIWNEYGNGIGSPEWIMIQMGRVGQKTSEHINKELRRTEILIKNFTKMIMIRTITTPEKMDEFIRKRNLRKDEKRKKKEERKKLKRLHRQMGYDEND